MVIWDVYTSVDMPKGSVYKEHNRWWWRRINGGVESFPNSTKQDVIDHISRLTRETCYVKKNKDSFS